MKFLLIPMILFVSAAGLYSRTVRKTLIPKTITNEGRVFRFQWKEEFNKATNSWAAGSWTFPSNLSEFYPKNVRFGRGQLVLQLTRKTDLWSSKYPDRDYYGAEYYTKGEFLYGRFTARMRPSAPPGVVSSFFLEKIVTDTNGKTADWRELDIEFPGKTESASFNAIWMDVSNRRPVARSSRLDPDLRQFPFRVPLDFDASKSFHDWTIEWTPDHAAFYCDGILLHEYTDANLMAELSGPMTIRMNLWVSDAKDWAGSFLTKSLPVQSYFESVSYFELLTN